MASQARVAKVSTEKQLRRAVKRANRKDGPDRIQLADGIRFAQRSTKGGAGRGDLDVTDDLTIVGLGHTIDANRVDRGFDVRADTRLTVRRATLTKGAPASGESGGAIRSRGTVELLGSKITRSRVTGTEASGGAVMNDGGRLRLLDSRLSATRPIGPAAPSRPSKDVRRSSGRDCSATPPATSPAMAAPYTSPEQAPSWYAPR